MSHHEETISFIVCRDWGAAADRIAGEIYKDKFWLLGARQQTELMSPIAKHLIFEYMQLKRQIPAPSDESMPVNFAEQILESAYSHFTVRSSGSGGVKDFRSDPAEYDFEKALEEIL